ncbi:MAG: hypothetical protein PHW59_04955, partial [Desulfobacterales bacterium]|nr:hypothetical protein [Desulfobacterales bacterium]
SNDGTYYRCENYVGYASRTRHFYKPGFIEQSRKKPIPSRENALDFGWHLWICHHRITPMPGVRQ